MEKRILERELRVFVQGEYLLQVPEGYASEGEPLPLLIFLHGMSQADEVLHLDAPPKFAYEGMDLGVVLASPYCSEMRWSVDLVLALADEIEGTVNVDPERVYVTGISIGGLATWEVALRAPDRFAAIVPICGAGQPWNAFQIRNLPCWAFHGALDEIVPVSESEAMVEAMNDGQGGEARLTVYKDLGHESWSRAYRDSALWTWLLAQRNRRRGRRGLD